MTTVPPKRSMTGSKRDEKKPGTYKLPLDLTFVFAFAVPDQNVVATRRQEQSFGLLAGAQHNGLLWLVR